MGNTAYGRGAVPFKTLYDKVVRLKGSLVEPLFAFDGPGRPAVKRGYQHSGDDHYLASALKELVSSFGCSYINVRRIRNLCHVLVSLAVQAPGEAEAELAQLCRIGAEPRLDAIYSDDNDALMFGAEIVLRPVQ